MSNTQRQAVQIATTLCQRSPKLRGLAAQLLSATVGYPKIGRKYVVTCAAASMPVSCWGTYRRVAVLELEDPTGPVPRKISTHARNCARVVETWEKLNVGSTSLCAYERALVEAKALANRLNVREGYELPEVRQVSQA